MLIKALKFGSFLDRVTPSAASLKDWLLRPDAAARGYESRRRQALARTLAPRGIWADIAGALDDLVREMRDVVGF